MHCVNFKHHVSIQGVENGKYTHKNKIIYHILCQERNFFWAGSVLEKSGPIFGSL